MSNSSQPFYYAPMIRNARSDYFMKSVFLQFQYDVLYRAGLTLFFGQAGCSPLGMPYDIAFSNSIGENTPQIRSQTDQDLG